MLWEWRAQVFIFSQPPNILLFTAAIHGCTMTVAAPGLTSTQQGVELSAGISLVLTNAESEQKKTAHIVSFQGRN